MQVTTNKPWQYQTHCRPAYTLLPPLRRPLHRAGFLVRIAILRTLPSTTSPPLCWFPGATLPSYGHPLIYDVPSTVLVSWCDTAVLRTPPPPPPPPPSTMSPPPCWFPGAPLPSYGHPLFYDIPSTVLVSWCDTAVLRTSTLCDIPSTMLVSWCDTAVQWTFTRYDVPSTVLVSWCDTAVLRTSTLCDILSTVLVSWCDTAVLRTSTLCDILSTVLVSWCDTAVLWTSTLYDVHSTVLVSWCDTAVLWTSTLYDAPSTVLVSWWDTAILRTPPPPPPPHLRRPLHRAGFLVRHCRPTTSLPSCSSPGATLLSYGPSPLSATTSPPPFCFPVPPNTLATTRQASVNSDNLVTLTVPHKATSHPTGNSRPAQNSLRLAYFNAQSCCQKASKINDLVVDGDFDILLMTETWLFRDDPLWLHLPLVPMHRPQGWRHCSQVQVCSVWFHLHASSAVQLVWVGGTAVIR